MLRQFGIPEYAGFGDRWMLRAGRLASWIAPGMVMPAVLRKMRSQSRRVVLRERQPHLGKYVASRKVAGFRVNINQLGEAVLGEEEAARRLDAVVGLLGLPDVEYVSVKISSVCSQIEMMEYEQSLDIVCERLRRIYREAKKHPVQHPDGRVTRKFVNLDMEEYEDVGITLDAFRRVLEEPEFAELEAGIVLQAYLPEAYKLQRDLTEWAHVRRKAGGAPVKLRIVKGANLAMEQVVAESEGWPLATFSTKPPTDANFKRMVAFGTRRENVDSVRLGIGSHNLFDIAYAMICRELNGAGAFVEFEMLEGMANHQARVLKEAGAGLVLYAPIVKSEDFHHALAYLIRRLDENSTDGNFLRDSFSMRMQARAWDKHAEAFRASTKLQEQLQSWSNRSGEENGSKKVRFKQVPGFQNEPNTDWTVAARRKALSETLVNWSRRPPVIVPVVIDGKEWESEKPVDGFDPSQPDVVPYQVSHADTKQVANAVNMASRAWKNWGGKSVEERKRILNRCGDGLANGRLDLIGALVMDGGKSVAEADAEVSEAVDFARYYATAFDKEHGITDCVPTGRGVTVVVPPWNFPLAIPAGGVLAALMAGNSVILKPAPETPFIAWELVRHLWDAGVPQDVLQFVPCEDGEAGKALVTHNDVDTVVLTGSLETAEMFRGWKPTIRLLAETSGKNSILVTANADRDEAVRALAHSAFSHSGQKCSAASLAILEAEVYDSASFRRQLRDAVASLRVGTAWEAGNTVTPLVRQPDGLLKDALTKLGEGEEWLLEPRVSQDNPRLWSPGIKLGVAGGSSFHLAECFGPVLGLMRAKNLREGIALQNATDFGLTAGIQSLDEREVRLWRDSVEAGNLYVNRSITGAIVRRQPFGGWKASAVGPGAKAGGPNYVYGFSMLSQKRLPEEVQRAGPNPETLRFLDQAKRALRDEDERQLAQTMCWNFAWAHQRYFLRGHDPTRLKGELNVLRYHPVEKMVYRFGAQDAENIAILATVMVAKTTGVPLVLSLHPALKDQLKILGHHSECTINVEPEKDFIASLPQISPLPAMLRIPGGATREVLSAAAKSGIPVDENEVVVNGRLELRFWFREQTVSQTRHRYGNILQRKRDRR
ncbi:MAG: bifunctional proline dehydrogenase/L-glutamate gamma-semialdehyde dehydrogenase [Verrucomicrobiota bacterium]